MGLERAGFEIGPNFFLSAIFALLGMAYFMYGKKQSDFYVIMSGVGLMFFPYFTSSISSTVGIGALLLLFPFLAKKFL